VHDPSDAEAVGHVERRCHGSHLYYGARGHVAHARELRDGPRASTTGMASTPLVEKYVPVLKGVLLASGLQEREPRY
jgi:hypothetical protein